jgi:hypothetical protein
MAKTSRFVRPGETVLTLANGDTLTVRRRLNAGQQRAAFNRMYMAGADGKMHVDPLMTGVALVTAYLLDWTLRDDDDRPVDIRGAAVEELIDILDSLDPQSFTEIKEAIERHEGAMIAARLAEKNDRDGERNEPAISLSQSEPAGASTGSAT